MLLGTHVVIVHFRGKGGLYLCDGAGEADARFAL